LVSAIWDAGTKFCKDFSMLNLTLLTAAGRGVVDEENNTNGRYSKAKEDKQRKGKG